MIDREKVLSGLECCVDDSMACGKGKPFENCPYLDAKDEILDCCGVLMRDALTLLKEELIAKQGVNNAPTVETYPVCPKHGRWVYGEKSDAYDKYGVKTWALAGTCSECGFTHKFIEGHTCYAFCPDCGARLDA